MPKDKDKTFQERNRAFIASAARGLVGHLTGGGQGSQKPPSAKAVEKARGGLYMGSGPIKTYPSGVIAPTDQPKKNPPRSSSSEARLMRAPTTAELNRMKRDIESQRSMVAPSKKELDGLKKKIKTQQQQRTKKSPPKLPKSK